MKMEEKRMRGRGDGENEGDGEGWGEGGADGTDEEERRGEEIMGVMEEERGRGDGGGKEKDRGEGGGVISKGESSSQSTLPIEVSGPHSLQECGVNVSGQNTPGHPGQLRQRPQWGSATTIQRAATQQPPAQTQCPPEDWSC